MFCYKCVFIDYNNKGYSALGPVWQEPDPIQATGMAPIRCILAKFLGVVCHCFPPRLDVPTFAARCLHVPHDARDPNNEMWNYGREMSGNFDYMTYQFTPLGIFYMPQNLRRGTDGFTSPTKEGVLRIFSSLKIRQFRPGLNPRTWVLKTSTVPLDHRSRFVPHNWH